MDALIRTWLLQSAIATEQARQEVSRKENQEAKLANARAYAKGVRTVWRATGKLKPITNRSHHGQASKDRSTD